MDVVIGLVVMGIALWVSIKFLKFMFVKSKEFAGWIGPYLAAAIPASGAFIVTTTLFGAGVSEATITGFLTAAIIGTVMNGA